MSFIEVWNVNGLLAVGNKHLPFLHYTYLNKSLKCEWFGASWQHLHFCTIHIWTDVCHQSLKSQWFAACWQQHYHFYTTRLWTYVCHWRFKIVATSKHLKILIMSLMIVKICSNKSVKDQDVNFFANLIQILNIFEWLIRYVYVLKCQCRPLPLRKETCFFCVTDMSQVSLFITT